MGEDIEKSVVVDGVGEEGQRCRCGGGGGAGEGQGLFPNSNRHLQLAPFLTFWGFSFSILAFSLPATFAPLALDHLK